HQEAGGRINGGSAQISTSLERICRGRALADDAAMPAITIKPERLLADLHRLRTFGAYQTGVHRPTYSADDMAARRWLVTRMQEAGLAARMDGIGNIIGENTA